MGTPGSVVVRASGAWGVLPSGAVAVRNDQGGCPTCCDGGTHTGECYVFNQGQCSARQNPPLNRLTDAQMQWSASNTDTPPLGGNYNVANQVLGASGIPLSLACYNEGDGLNSSTQIVQQPPGGPLTWTQFALGHYLTQDQLTRSLWVPWVILPGNNNVDPSYYMRIHCDQFNFYARWNLNNNAVQVSADILGELSLGRLRQRFPAADGYTNVNGAASIAAAIAWQGCVPTMTMTVSGSFTWNYPPNHETHGATFAATASSTFTGLIT